MFLKLHLAHDQRQRSPAMMGDSIETTLVSPGKNSKVNYPHRQIRNVLLMCMDDKIRFLFDNVNNGSGILYFTSIWSWRCFFFFPPRFLGDGERVHIESKELFNICMSASGMMWIWKRHLGIVSDIQYSASLIHHQPWLQCGHFWCFRCVILHWEIRIWCQVGRLVAVCQRVYHWPVF